MLPIPNKENSRSPFNRKKVSPGVILDPSLSDPKFTTESYQPAKPPAPSICNGVYLTSQTHTRHKEEDHGPRLALGKNVEPLAEK
jgi:hypothetical protein